MQSPAVKRKADIEREMAERGEAIERLLRQFIDCLDILPVAFTGRVKPIFTDYIKRNSADSYKRDTELLKKLEVAEKIEK